jgi:protein involved in polysaccharide export with SLBB domain
MRLLSLRWVFCIALLVPSLPLRLSAQSQTEDATSSTLRPGDVLRLTVWQRPELSGDYSVARDGSLAHPISQGLRLAGVPLVVVEQRVRALLKTYVSEPQVTVQPLIHAAVSGEVRQPGLLLVTTPTSVAQLVARAGGPTDKGEMSRVRLVRGDQQLLLDLSGPSLAASPVQVRSGDQIWVDRQGRVLQDNIMPIASLVSAIALSTYYGLRRH